MDGSFACPECGSTVEVHGLSPGRQTRCEFCNRLVEIPFMPRVDPSWRRRRFRRPRWVIACWSAIVLVLVAIVLGGVSHLLVNRSRLERLQAVERLIRSAAQRRDSADFGLALVDLDSAIELLGSDEEGGSRSRLAELRRMRGDAARRDAEKILADLTERDESSHSAGGWLNLRSRISKDPDLAPLKAKVEAQFQAALQRRIESEYRAARSSLQSRGFAQSLESCLRLDRELKFLPADAGERWKARLLEVVGSLVEGPGVVVTMSEGHLLEGSDEKSYAPKILATVTEALHERGYLPPPPAVPWRDLWSRAPFRMNLEVTERREGNYQASQNRLARIEVELVLSRDGTNLWRITSTSRSRVPLPDIPASFSHRLAISPARIVEFEGLLYRDARSRVGDRLAIAVKEIPPCPVKPDHAAAPG